MKKSRKYHQVLLAAGHFCADLNQGILSATLPFLIAAHHYDYATAGSLVMLSNIIGSIMQPIFGHLADKKNIPGVMAVGVLMAGGGMAAIGFTSNFVTLSIAVIISGIGVALFHPTGALLINKVAEKNRQGASMSIFSFGGNLGFTIGPLLTTAAIVLFGMKGTIIFIIPVAIEAAALIAANSDLEEINKSARDSIKSLGEKVRDDWKTFYKICGIIVGRSIIFYSWNTFLALYWINNLWQDKVTGNGILTVFFAVVAFNTLFGGRLSDKFGHANIIRLSFALIVPFAFLLANSTTTTTAFLAMLPIGAAIGMCYSPIVITGQNSLPNHKGLASGVALGLSVSIGGIFMPLLGEVGNRFGLDTTLLLTAAISIIPLIISFRLPK